MILILFYLAMVIAAGLLIVFGFSFYLRSRQISSSEDQRINLYPPDPELYYRPLFAPGEDEIRALERAGKEAEKEQARETGRQSAQTEAAEKARAAQDFLAEWRKAPDKKRAGRLLLIAAQSERAEIFSEISKNVIQVWHENKIAGLKAADLADLLDSHFRILPQQELVSGALFWLKQEIATLRSRGREE